jgi:transposase
MGKPYSIDLRERVQADIENGQSRRAAARRYDVSASFAVKLAERISLTGSAEPARQGRPPGGGKLARYLTALIGWVEAEPDISARRSSSLLPSRFLQWLRSERSCGNSCWKNSSPVKCWK